MIRILSTALLALSLTVSGAFATSMDDLVERKGLYYKKFTETPFTGKVDEGREQGKLKRGKREGRWVFYHENGHLRSNGAFKNGEMEGPWVGYNYDGTKDEDVSGIYRDGEKISD